MTRFALSVSLSLAALSLAAMPAAACEKHQSHAVLASGSATPAPPAAPASEPQSSAIVISPASAAAMSTAEALGEDPQFMRCRYKQRQVLTQ